MELAARLDDQSREMAGLKSALAVQCTRIRQMQAQLDVLPNARRRGEELRGGLTRVSASNGDGHRQ
jgi:uncharacterized coiled-coil protein SlyX